MLVSTPSPSFSLLSVKIFWGYNGHLWIRHFLALAVFVACLLEDKNSANQQGIAWGAPRLPHAWQHLNCVVSLCKLSSISRQLLLGLPASKANVCAHGFIPELAGPEAHKARELHTQPLLAALDRLNSCFWLVLGCSPGIPAGVWSEARRLEPVCSTQKAFCGRTTGSRAESSETEDKPNKTFPNEK